VTTARRLVRVAAYALCVDADDRVLLCRIAPAVSATDAWTLPGGGLEFGEEPEVGVLRELEEETGLTGRVVGLVEVGSRLLRERDWAHGADVHNLSIVYRVAAEPGELRREADGSTDGCAWVTRDQTARLPLWELARGALRHAWSD
jgi:8-oxo-dGTP diphosphatase